MVPAVLSGWRWVRRDLGLVFYPRDGTSSTMRIRAREPLRPAAAVIATLIDELTLSSATVGTLEPLITVEGEYGVTVSIAAAKAGRPVELQVAVLFGDDWLTTIEGIASPEHIASVGGTVLELARTYSLGLGQLRRRRYRYTTPVDWVHRTRGLIDEWHQSTSSICVFPARPLVETAAGAVDRALHELVIDGFVTTVDQHVPLKTARFAKGIARFVSGTRDAKPICYDVAVLQDERFSYVARLESPADALAANRDIFAALVESIEPLPQPQHASSGVDPALTASWVD